MCRLAGNSGARAPTPDAIAHHRDVFAQPPTLVTADRGVHSADTEEKLKTAGVKLVAIPAVGKASEERRAWERRGVIDLEGGAAVAPRQNARKTTSMFANRALMCCLAGAS